MDFSEKNVYKRGIYIFMIYLMNKYIWREMNYLYLPSGTEK